MRWFEDLERALRLYEELKDAPEEERQKLLREFRELGASEKLLKALQDDLGGEWSCERDTC